jgi:hypothetical protein
MRSLITLLPVIGSLIATSRAAPTCLTELPCEMSSTTSLATRDLNKRSSWAPAQGGCWTDNVNNVRALEHGMGSYNDLTPGKCQSLCEAQGFNLAGVEYGRECCKHYHVSL